MSVPPDRTEERSSRAHVIGMILCCIPMVIAIAWVMASSR